ncbi:unnamed protein product [Amoebophrya sp. A25]|nr:unnamed protein product [Amoebophrya sp. A25]|eukprot:GSA25T00016434001.1
MTTTASVVADVVKTDTTKPGPKRPSRQRSVRVLSAEEMLEAEQKRKEAQTARNQRR